MQICIKKAQAHARLGFDDERIAYFKLLRTA
jgi:hypothetical protein